MDHSTPTKVCTKCGETKPLDNFAKVNRGRRTICKPCFNAVSRANYLRALQSNQTKLCSMCQSDLPVAAFDCGPGGLYGARSHCRDCARAKRVAYEAANHDAVLARQRADYQANRDRRIASTRKYAAAHPDAVKQLQSAYYKKNREQLIAKQKARRDANIEEYKRREAKSSARNIEKRRVRFREWLAANPEKMRAAQRSYRKRHPEKHAEHEARRRALKNNTPIMEKIDRTAIIARDNSTCYLCDRVLSRDEITLDHYIPLSAGGPHTAANLRVACRPCNSRKWTHMPPD